MNIVDLVAPLKLYLLDMDGTLYLGDRLFPCTLDFLEAVKSIGGRYLFMTNNSSKSVTDYIQKLEKMGISAVPEDFITSSQATCYYLSKHHRGKKLYLCTTRSFRIELENAGFEITEDPHEAQCIVMGFDTELTFQKLHDISYLLTVRPDIPYIASNPDYVCPTEFGYVPDCGSVSQMLYNATGRMPLFIGKPEPLMPQLAMERLAVAPENTCVIGDRIYTDIKSGLNAGITSILVMSGETTEKVLMESEDQPHLVVKDVSEITKTIRKL